MQKKYREIYFTNHALKRMKERGIKQGDVYATWNRPDESRFSRKRGGWVYSRNISGNDIKVVAVKNDKKEWVVISVWSKPKGGKIGNGKSIFNKLLKRLFI